MLSSCRRYYPTSGGLEEVVKVYVFSGGSGVSSELDTIKKADSNRVNFFIFQI